MMASLDKKDEKFSNKLAKEYDRIQNELEKDIAYWYQNYGRIETMEYRAMMKKLTAEEQSAIFRDFDKFVADNPKYSHLVPVRENIYKLNRLEAMQLSVRLKMAELGVIEDEQMTKYLESSYKFGYESTMKNLQNKGAFYNFNNRQLELTLSDKWFNEKNYSDRIWDNKNTLRNWLTSDLATGLQQGVSYDKMVKQLQQRMDVGKFYAKRLVWTESAFFLNTANANAFKADGIQQYEYVAIIDDRTTKTCQSLNAEVFDFDDYKPGVNAPPMHSFCRSTIVPIENSRVKAENASGSVYNEGEGNEAYLAIDKMIRELDMDTAQSTDIINLGKAFENEYKISTMLGEKERIKDVFGLFREMGGSVPDKLWYTRSNKTIKNQLQEAFSYYPEDWANYIADNDKKIFAGKTGRGFFSSQLVNSSGRRYLTGASPGMGVSIYSSGNRATTAFHEIGHMVDYFNPNLVRIERDFVNSRTEGEELTKLADIFPGYNYRDDEVVKRDHFISPYIGKDYGERATEVLSVGLESIFEPGEGQLYEIGKNGTRYVREITDDPEYLHLIIGLILKG